MNRSHSIQNISSQEGHCITKDTLVKVSRHPLQLVTLPKGLGGKGQGVRVKGLGLREKGSEVTVEG
jgi:hypothetical protein